jgi:hypothetical protein
MALTVTTVTQPQVLGTELKCVTLQVTWDSSYPTGGETIDTSVYDMTTITGFQYMGDAKADIGYVFGLTGTRAAGGITAATDTKIAAYWQTDVTTSALIEVANTTDLSAVVHTVILWGK